MLIETMEQKKARIFEAYKKRLCDPVILSDGTVISDVRYNVIQYLCKFPGIEPVEMAAAIISDGFNVLFDDSSISKSENEKNRRAVYKLARGKATA